MTCFADINFSRGSPSVGTYARCGGKFNIHLTANLPKNLVVKIFINRLRFDSIIYGHELVAPFPHPVEQTPCYRNEIRSDKIAPSISKKKSSVILVDVSRQC